MVMEKRGVIDENTPHHGPGETDQEGQPTTKQAADSMQSGLPNDATDAVAEQTDKNAAQR